MKKEITNINLIIYITLINTQKEKKFFSFSDNNIKYEKRIK